MKTAMDEKEFARKIESMGGRAYIVGGWVRDKLLHVEPKDKDYVICGISADDFARRFPDALKAGKSFPVYRTRIGNKVSEIAFARTERKSGTGYRGFDVRTSPDITIEDDLYRRDTTMNSIAVDILTGEFIDPFGGIKDAGNKIIRAVSDHFMEDPVRALRAARQAAQTGFTIEPLTIKLMSKCGDELIKEPAERIKGELMRALTARKPSIFFEYLRKADLLQGVFPEIAALIGKTQPKEFHPEGDAYMHTLDILDKVSLQTEETVARFAALCHDLGKGTTPNDMLPHHYGHEIRGQDVFREWDKRMKFPVSFKKMAIFTIKTHMRAPLHKKPGKIVDLLMDIYKSAISFESYNAVILADHGMLPSYLSCYKQIMPVMLSISGNEHPERLKGKQIGEWIRDRRIRAYMKVMHDMRMS